ncbi:MAG: hypothetical protein JSU96_00655, partial [Acidobacteriota bacterium]
HDASWLISQGQWSAPIPLPFSSSGPWEPRLASAGAGRFHALLLGASHVFYLEFSGNRWSTPVDLGPAHTTTFWGWHGETIQIGSDTRGRALAVWPVKKGLAGRWIEIGG